MKDTDLAWAAGFMDGDGCFTIAFCNGSFTAQLKATGKDARPLLKLKETLGGRVYPYKSVPGRDFTSKITMMYEWSCTNSQLVKHICELLHPYLVLKKQQAECVIQLIELKPRGSKATEEIFLQQAILHQMCSQLKKDFIGLAAETKREGQLFEVEPAKHEEQAELELEDAVCDSPNCRDDKPAEVAEMTTRLEVIK